MVFSLDIPNDLDESIVWAAKVDCVVPVGGVDAVDVLEAQHGDGVDQGRLEQGHPVQEPLLPGQKDTKKKNLISMAVSLMPYPILPRA